MEKALLSYNVGQIIAIEMESISLNFIPRHFTCLTLIQALIVIPL